MKARPIIRRSAIEKIFGFKVKKDYYFVKSGKIKVYDYILDTDYMKEYELADGLIGQELVNYKWNSWICCRKIV